MEKVSQIIDLATNFLASFGPISGFFLIILESIIPVLPLGVFVGLNMLAFGNIFGLIISYIATICGCMASYCLFRYLLKDKFQKLLRKKTLVKLKPWMDKLANIKFSTLVAIIAFPPTPAFLVNIAAGLSGVGLRKYLLALAIGKPAMLIFYGYIAVSFVDSLKDPKKNIYVMLLVLGAYIFSKLLERVVNVEK